MRMGRGEADEHLTFDSIAYKRQVQQRMIEVTKDMSPAEELAYYRHCAETGSLGDWWRSVRGREEAVGDRGT